MIIYDYLRSIEPVPERIGIMSETVVTNMSRGEVVEQIMLNNPEFRLATRDDLVAGKRMWMRDVENLDPSFRLWGTEITLDDPPTQDGDQGTYVMYHCRNWEGQCFVPIHRFFRASENLEELDFKDSIYFIKED